MVAPLFAASGGPAAGLTLLLIHPMGADHRFWNDCRKTLEQSFRCIAVDLRGAGSSSPLTEPYPIEGHAADLEAFCVAKGLGRVVAVGCAVGAMIVAAFAARNPDRCAALVLSNPGYRTTPEARVALAVRAATVRAKGIAGASEAVDRSFFGHSDAERVEAYRRLFLTQRAEAYALQIEGMLHADVAAALGSITCPTFVVGGGRDVLLPLEHAQKTAKALPDAELVVIEQAAHLIPYQYPDLFAQAVSEFLARKLPSAQQRNSLS